MDMHEKKKKMEMEDLFIMVAESIDRYLYFSMKRPFIKFYIFHFDGIKFL